MSENTTIKVNRLVDGSIVQIMPDGSTKAIEKSGTDWNKLNSITDAEAEAAALADPDNPPLTREELNRLRPIPDLKLIRKTLHMTQEQFSESFRLPLGTVRDWEQGAKQPDTAARVLLQVISKDPEAVLHALEA